MSKQKKEPLTENSTKEKLIGASIELFAQAGYDAVSMKDLATAAGITQGTIYNHFESKADILTAILDRFPDTEAIIQMLPGHDEIHQIQNTDQLAAFLKNIWRNWRKGMVSEKFRKIKRIVTVEQTRNERANQFMKGYVLEWPQRYYKTVFQIMQTHGIIRPHCLKEMVDLFIARINAVEVEAYLFNTDFNFAAAEKDFFGFIDFYCDLIKS